MNKLCRKKNRLSAASSSNKSFQKFVGCWTTAGSRDTIFKPRRSQKKMLCFGSWCCLELQAGTGRWKDRPGQFPHRSIPHRQGVKPLKLECGGETHAAGREHNTEPWWQNGREKQGTMSAGWMLWQRRTTRKAREETILSAY